MNDSGAGIPVFREVPFTGPEAAALIAQLQQEYVVRYGGPDETPVDGDQFSPPVGMFVLALIDGAPVGCVGIRAHDEVSAEMKRLYVRPEFRRRGVAAQLLEVAERRAHELNYRRVVLETGSRQPEAIALYQNSGYAPRPGFGFYAEHSTSMYFTKDLTGPTP